MPILHILDPERDWECKRKNLRGQGGRETSDLLRVWQCAWEVFFGEYIYKQLIYLEKWGEEVYKDNT